MKTILTAAVLLIFKLSPIQAQCPGLTQADVWLWNYTGDQRRGGVLALNEGDYVIGSAQTSSGFPYPNNQQFITLDPCTWNTPWGRNVGGAITLDNLTPECNGINYTMGSTGSSDRSDGRQDHISQSAWAWGSNPGDASTPAIIAQTEAGSLYGTGQYAGQPGFPDVFTDRTGYCGGANLL